MDIKKLWNDAKANAEMKGQVSIARVIIIFITMLVGVVLLEPFANEVAGVGGNVTGAALSITQLLPLFFALIILLVAVAAITLRRRGG